MSEACNFLEAFTAEKHFGKQFISQGFTTD